MLGQLRDHSWSGQLGICTVAWGFPLMVADLGAWEHLRCFALVMKAVSAWERAGAPLSSAAPCCWGSGCGSLVLTLGVGLVLGALTAAQLSAAPSLCILREQCWVPQCPVAPAQGAHITHEAAQPLAPRSAPCTLRQMFLTRVSGERVLGTVQRVLPSGSLSTPRDPPSPPMSTCSIPARGTG